MTRPRFRDPRDRWPELGEQLPQPFPGPHGDSLAALAEYVPSLSEERRLVIARAMFGTERHPKVFARTLQEHAPDLFELAPAMDRRW